MNDQKDDKHKMDNSGRMEQTPLSTRKFPNPISPSFTLLSLVKGLHLIKDVLKVNIVPRGRPSQRAISQRSTYTWVQGSTGLNL